MASETESSISQVGRETQLRINHQPRFSKERRPEDWKQLIKMYLSFIQLLTPFWWAKIWKSLAETKERLPVLSVNHLRFWNTLYLLIWRLPDDLLQNVSPPVASDQHAIIPSIAIHVYAGIALMSCLSFPRGPINLHSTIYNLCSAHSYD